MVITTMFHGTVFSIKYNKEFCVILESYRVNKIKDMLFELKLDNRILNDNDKDFDKVFLKKIDYEFVNKKIEDMVIESRNYIAEALRIWLLQRNLIGVCSYDQNRNKIFIY